MLNLRLTSRIKYLSAIVLVNLFSLLPVAMGTLSRFACFFLSLTLFNDFLATYIHTLLTVIPTPKLNLL